MVDAARRLTRHWPWFICDPAPTRHPVVRVLLLVGKNLLGFSALLLGGLLAVPGVPGPGLVVMLLALMLLDFPGKYAVERWLVTRKPVRNAIDTLRERAGREPLRRPASRSSAVSSIPQLE